MAESMVISNPQTITSGGTGSFDVVIDGSLSLGPERVVFIEITSGTWAFSVESDASLSGSAMTSSTTPRFPLTLTRGRFNAKSTAAGVSFNIYW